MKFKLIIEVADSDTETPAQLAQSKLDVTDELIKLDLTPGVEVFVALHDVERID